MSFCLSGRFLGIVSSIFSKFRHGVIISYEVYGRARLSKINLFAPKIEKMGPKWSKNRISPFIGKCGHSFLLNLIYNENLYNLLCSCKITYLEKKFFLRYGPKCSQPISLQDFLINHISRTNQWNSLIFCVLAQIYINQKFIKNFLVGVVRWMWSAWSQGSKIDCISRMSWLNDLILCMLVQIQES